MMHLILERLPRVVAMVHSELEVLIRVHQRLLLDRVAQHNATWPNDGCSG